MARDNSRYAISFAWLPKTGEVNLDCGVPQVRARTLGVNLGIAC